MKPGSATTYINERLAGLLDEHGPETGDGTRGLAEKLGYILPAWDAVLREEKARWRALLAREEWESILQACWSHAFAMETGGAYDLDLSGAILACVEDSLPGELATGNPDALKAKLRGASAAAQLALAWMVIRERVRRGSPAST